MFIEIIVIVIASSAILLYYINSFSYSIYYTRANVDRVNIHDFIYSKWDSKSLECKECNENLVLVKVKDQYNDFFIFVRKENDSISNEIINNGDWGDCKEIQKLWSSLPGLESGDYFLDAGANIGICSFHLLNRNIKTIAIEPIPNNLHIMTKSLLYNSKWTKNIELHKTGLGNKTDIKIINILKGNWGGSSILNLNQNYYTKRISILKLDYLLQNFKHKIHLASIDIQGYELFMLEGAKETLQKGIIRHIYMEIWCDALLKINISENDIYNLLEKYNYKIKQKLNCSKKYSFNVVASLYTKI